MKEKQQGLSFEITKRRLPLYQTIARETSTLLEVVGKQGDTYNDIASGIVRIKKVEGGFIRVKPGINSQKEFTKFYEAFNRYFQE